MKYIPSDVLLNIIEKLAYGVPERETEFNAKLTLESANP
jgi:hypothetical protein